MGRFRLGAHPCPADGLTARAKMKDVVTLLNDAMRTDTAEIILRAIDNTDQYLLWDKIQRKPK